MTSYKDQFGGIVGCLHIYKFFDNVECMKHIEKSTFKLNGKYFHYVDTNEK